MSFGLSSGGGQVRYAVVFDSTQAEQNVRRYQTSLQQLATGTTGVSGKMAIMNNTFTAGVAPIKNTGNALNQLSTTQKTLGSQLGGIASGFKSNALAIGAAASSVLGLYQNYANLSSAQNNANKSATAAKAAQNNLTKAQDNLNKAIDKYGRGSKEAKAAQDKLTVAQERAVNKTESAKIAQDNLNQTMADFGINILPNVLLAGGSIVSIFDGIGSKGKILSGITSKLGGVFDGLGKSITGSGGGIKGLIGNLGALGLAAVGAVGLFEEFNAQLKIHQDVMNKTIKPIEGVTRTLDQMSKLDFSTIESSLISLVKIIGGSGGYAELIKKIGQQDIDKLSKPVTALSTAEQKLATDEAKLISLQKERQTIGVKQEEEQLKKTIELDKAEIARIKTIKETTNTWALQSKAFEGNVTSINAANKAYLDVHNTIVATNPDLQKIIEQTRLHKQQIDATNEALKHTPEEYKTAATFTQLFGDKTKYVIDLQNELKDKLDSSSQGMTGFEGAIQAGVTQFQTLVDVTMNNVLQLKAYRTQLIASVGSQIGFSDAAKMSTADLELNQRAMLNDTDAIKTLNDALTNAAKTGFSDFIESTKKIMGKKFEKLGFVDSFNRIQKEADKFQAGFIKSMDKGGTEAAKAFAIKFSQTPKKFIKPRDLIAFDSLISWIKANAGLPADEFSKQLAAKWKDLAPEQQAKFGQLMEGFPDVAAKLGTTTGEAFGESMATAASKTAKDLLSQALKNFNPANYIADPKNTKKKGVFKSTDPTLFNSGQTQKMPAIDQTAYQKGLQLAINNAAQTVKLIAAKIAEVSGIKMPTPNESTYQKGLQLAINNAAQTVQFIKKSLDKIAGIKVPSPNESKYQKGLQLAIDNAAQTVDLIGKELAKIGKISIPAPKFNKFNSALDQAISDAKRAVREINNALNNVKKPSGGTGQQGAYGGAKGDTSSFSKSNSGSGGGDINLSVNVLGEKLITKLKRNMVTNRYTYGI